MSVYACMSVVLILYMWGCVPIDKQPNQRLSVQDPYLVNDFNYDLMPIMFKTPTTQCICVL